MRVPLLDLGIRRVVAAVTAMSVLVVAACGGPGSSTTTPPPPKASSLQLLVSSGNLQADGASTVTLTALVKDNNNNAMPDQVVTFSSDAGSISVDNAGKTDKNGLATATLSTLGDKSTRVIKLTATTGSLTAKNSVQTSGSKVSIAGVSSVVTGNSTQLTIRVQDGAGKAVSQQPVTLKSSLNNTFTQGGSNVTSVTTDSSGQATVTYVATNAGTDTLVASALNENGALVISVSGDQFTISAGQSEVALGSPVQIVAQYRRGGAPVPQGTQVVFASTRGALSTNTATTDVNGFASVTITSDNAGKATLTATSGSVSAQQTIEFVATSPNTATSTLQAERLTVVPKGSTAITATIRDARGNLVKNQIVTFNLNDVTGGTLSVASGVTDSFGQTSTTYTAGNVASAKDGVKISALVGGSVPVANGKTLDLTVAGQSLFIRLGTGNLISAANSTQYQMPYSILVTDSGGNPVSGALVQLQVQPYDDPLDANNYAYYKGFWTVDTTANAWVQIINARCRNEDLNLNGILDTGEDQDGDGALSSGIVAAATPSSVTTDATGSAFVNVIYGKNYAYWAKVKLIAKATVQGSEFQNGAVIVLPGLADDYKDTKVSPPGVVSPFGTNTCNARG